MFPGPAEVEHQAVHARLREGIGHVVEAVHGALASSPCLVQQAGQVGVLLALETRQVLTDLPPQSLFGGAVGSASGFDGEDRGPGAVGVSSLLEYSGVRPVRTRKGP
jgi:hypothetical protein